jgi:hypothetical protein
MANLEALLLAQEQGKGDFADLLREVCEVFGVPYVGKYGDSHPVYGPDATLRICRAEQIDRFMLQYRASSAEFSWIDHERENGDLYLRWGKVEAGRWKEDRYLSIPISEAFERWLEKATGQQVEVNTAINRAREELRKRSGSIAKAKAALKDAAEAM